MIYKIIGFILLGYLCGNFSISRIITSIKAKKGNVATKEDSTNSGNPGTMNMLRTQGATLGVVTLVVDAIKAAIPALIAFYVFGGVGNMPYSKIALYITGLSAVLGHIFPVFYGFKGGKGIASSVGVFFVANPIFSLCTFGACLIFFLFVKIGSLTSFLFILSSAVFETFWDKNYEVIELIIFVWLIIVVDLWAHRNNIKKLFLKSERIASLQEGVKKDIDKIRAKKQAKVKNLENKKNDDLVQSYNEKKEKINDRYVKKENKLKEKYETKENKIVKKQNKVTNKYDKKAVKVVKKADKKVEKIKKFVSSNSDVNSNKTN